MALPRNQQEDTSRGTHSLLVFVLALFTTTIQTTPAMAQVYSVTPEEFCDVPTSTTVVESCPANNDGDWTPIFERMMDDPICSPPYSTASSETLRNKYEGCHVKLACDFTYRFTSTLDVCRPIRFEGCDGGAAVPTSRFSFAQSDPTGIKTFQTCPRSGVIGDGSGASFEYLGILAATAPQSGDTGAGIQMDRRAYVSHVVIDSFMDGIRIDSGTGTNANAFGIEHTRLTNAGRFGLYVRGADTNAGNIVGLSVEQACSQAGAWTQGSPAASTSYVCAGIYDNSFLGNTYVGSHVASIENTGGTSNCSTHTYYPSYLIGVGLDGTINNNTRTVLFGPYEESSGCSDGTGTKQGVYSEVRGTSIIVGGRVNNHPALENLSLNNNSGGTLRFNNPSTWADTDQANLTFGSLGLVSGYRNVLQFGAWDSNGTTCTVNSDCTDSICIGSICADHTDTWRLGYNDLRKTWEFVYGGLSVPALGFTTDVSTYGSNTLRKDTVWLSGPNLGGVGSGYYVGPTNAPIWMGTGPCGTLPTVTDIPPGSRYRCTDKVTSGDVVEYFLSCTTSGAARNGNACTTGSKGWVAISTLP